MPFPVGAAEDKIEAPRATPPEGAALLHEPTFAGKSSEQKILKLVNWRKALLFYVTLLNLRFRRKIGDTRGSLMGALGGFGFNHPMK